MAVPKGKVSKARRNSRHSANSKAMMPTLTACPSCHELKMAHRTCAKCGTYDSRKVVETEKKKKETK